MQERSPLRKNFKPLLEDALEILKDPFSNPDADNYKMITYVVKNCDFFRQQFQSSAKLNQFANLSKDHLNYEVHRYGQVLFRENEISSKISIILKGDVQKYRQVPYKQIERKVNQRRATLLVKSDLHNTSTENQTPTCPEIKTSRHLFRQNLKVSFVDSQPERKPRSKNFLTVPPSKFEARPRRSSVESAMSIFSRFQPNPVQQDLDLESNAIKPLKKFQSSGLNLSNKFSSIKTTESIEDQNSSPLFLDNEETTQDTSGRCNITKNDEDLLRFISFKDPQIKLRYFVEDILRADKIETLSIGDYFGENFTKQPTVKEKNMMVVSSDELHLLTLTLTGYKQILEEMEKQINEKFLFFINLFPAWDKDSVIRFSQLFIQQYFSKDDIIYSQDDSSQDLYIVQEGEVRLYKNMPPTRDLIVPRKSIIPVSPKAGPVVSTPKSLAHLDFAPLFHSHRKIENNDLPVTSIVKKQFFGEEALLAKANRNYTAVANSSTVVAYVLSAGAYERARWTFSDFLELLTRQAKNKLEWRKQKENTIVPISLTEPRNSIVAANPYAFPKTWVQSLENNTNKNSTRLKYQENSEDEEVITSSVRNPKTSERRMVTEETPGRKNSIEIRFVTEETPELRKLSVYTAAYRSPRSMRIKTKGSIEESPTNLKKKSSKDQKVFSKNTSEKKTSLIQQSTMLSKIVTHSHNNPLIQRFSKKLNEPKKAKNFFPDVSSSQIWPSTTIVTNKSYEYATLHRIKKLANQSDLMLETSPDKIFKSVVVTSPKDLASPNKRVRLIKK